MGRRDHVAPRARRESCAARHSHRRGARGTRGGRRARRPSPRNRGPPARGAGLAARGSRGTPGGFRPRLRRPAHAAPARARPLARARLRLARTPPRQARADDRADRPPRTPAAGRRADHGRQHHHLDAPALDARLARLLREREPRRPRARGRPRGRLCADELPDAHRYRHVVERVSKRTKATEIEVARRAVELAAGGGDPRPGATTSGST